MSDMKHEMNVAKDNIFSIDPSLNNSDLRSHNQVMMNIMKEPETKFEYLVHLAAGKWQLARLF